MTNVILGLNPNHADSSACIIYENKLQSAIEEERINRIKHWAGIPNQSIKFCLEQSNLKLSDVTHISVNTSPKSNLKEKMFFFLKNYIFGKKKREIFKRLKKKASIKKDISLYFQDQKFNNKVVFNYHDHHLCHLASAFYPSEFDDAIGLSIDGFGDFSSLAIAECKNNKIKIIERIYFPNSLGIFYEAITQFIGFEKYGDEYKIMGLSSYGKPIYEEILQKELFVSNEDPLLNLKYFNHTNKNFEYKFEGEPIQSQILNDNFKKLINQNNYEIFEDFQKNMASSCQKIFENYLEKIINKILKRKFSKNLVYAGGCALNSLANKKIIENSDFEKVYIPYAPSDNGGSIGAALVTSNILNTKEKILNLQNPYLGASYDNIIIKEFINKNKLYSKYKISYFEKKDELHKKVAKLIYENNIVGFFSGRMEFGARALGNRSILANPGYKDVKDLINQKIKRRESFRPFAPAILEDKKNEWFTSNFFNPYMSSVENIISDKRKIIPGVTHIDGTGRVQSVSKKFNLNFYDLIYQFYKISRIPILLNTSFNENEPIVMTPQQAIDCFERTEMDVLIMENYCLSRV